MRAVDVHDLLGRPGASREWQGSEVLESVKTEMASVPPETPVDVDVRLESVVEGILVSGTLAGRMTFLCSRCLKEFSEGFDLGVRELFAHAAREGEDHYSITEGQIDLEPMVRDALVLSMPFSPLCSPGCLGLCARCGADLNLGECSCGPEVDPRWSALGSLKLDD